jgi:hypothetical protein
MVAGGSISATQIYRPQNIIAWSQSSIRFLFNFYLSKAYSSLDCRTWVDVHCPRVNPKASLGTSVRSVGVLARKYSCVLGQANSYFHWYRSSVCCDSVSRASTTPSLLSRAGTCLPRLYSQFRKYPRYHYWCIVSYYAKQEASC